MILFNIAHNENININYFVQKKSKPYNELREFTFIPFTIQ